MNFGAKIQITWFARFCQNSIFGQKYRLLTPCGGLNMTIFMPRNVPKISDEKYAPQCGKFGVYSD